MQEVAGGCKRFCKIWVDLDVEKGKALCWMFNLVYGLVLLQPAKHLTCVSSLRPRVNRNILSRSCRNGHRRHSMAVENASQPGKTSSTK